ncbi:ParB/RepB/Spo0J family partition protein [Methylocapsa sp. S129]|uniref:ParB/RepB/Spo0J family partition protein n=1 Tax=Methylocapsa sp. S129 TaxID=1641869 RepID=UPI00131DBC3A|nr:ParB/RepB/Spo0J family partition protein [Methylocapsa sp. S129]
MAEEAARPVENRPRLGRGLAALLGDVGEEAPGGERARGQRKTPIEFLRPNPRNPRKNFDDSDLDELAASIKERGVIQPVLVRAIPRIADAYEIVAGERRWRAAQRAGLHEIPILVIEAGDREALELAIVENVQRADLNALEEANGYAQLSADYSYSHTDIARIIGKSRSHIANTLRLLKLPDFARSLLASGQISAGHGRALLAVADPDATAKNILSEGLTVRDVERLGREPEDAPPSRPSAKAPVEVDADTHALEHSLSVALGTNVSIRHRGESGEVRIKFQNFEQLDDFCRRLCQDATSLRKSGPSA